LYNKILQALSLIICRNVFDGLRYNLGLMDINEVEGYGFENQVNTLQDSAGYLF